MYISYMASSLGTDVEEDHGDAGRTISNEGQEYPLQIVFEMQTTEADSGSGRQASARHGSAVFTVLLRDDVTQRVPVSSRRHLRSAQSAVNCWFKEQKQNTATAVSPFKVLEFGTVCRLNCEFQTLLLKHSQRD